jgi:hypothetical protein
MILLRAVFAVGVALALSAQTVPPPGATGRCRDLTYTKATNHRGACSGHGGVAKWLDQTPSDKPVPAKAAATAPARAAESSVPANATAECFDGSFSTSKHRQGTCSRNKGVKRWLKDLPSR